MTVCGSNEICFSPMQIPVQSPLYSQCLGLKDHISNGERLRRGTGAIAVGAGAVVVGSSFFTTPPALAAAPTAKPKLTDAGFPIAKVSIATGAVLFGGWSVHTHLRLQADRAQYERLGCAAILEKATAFRSISKTPLQRAITDSCWGADILLRGCTPQRHAGSPSEWSTEAPDPKTVMVVGGGLALFVVTWEAALCARAATLTWTAARTLVPAL